VLLACEKKPGWPETDERLVDDDCVVLFDTRPWRSSSISLSFWKTFSKVFCRSFSMSAVSMTVIDLFLLTKFEVPASLSWQIKLTRSARELAADSVPLLSEIVLDALQSIKRWHFLRSFRRTAFASSIVGRVLMLYGLGRRALRPNFVGAWAYVARLVLQSLLLRNNVLVLTLWFGLGSVVAIARILFVRLILRLVVITVVDSGVFHLS